MLFDQAAVESIVAGGHGRVRREHRLLGDFAERVRRKANPLVHAVGDHLQRSERAVPFV